MKVLQLCCFSNHWGQRFEVKNVDITNGDNVLDIDNMIGLDYDFILSAPPCTQFTKANQHNWELLPGTDIEIVKKCLLISEISGKPFVIENPPGRIEKLIPELVKYRQITLNDITTNKEWVLYSNMLLLKPFLKRYGRKSISNLTKIKRLEYPPYFINYLKSQLYGYPEYPR